MDRAPAATASRHRISAELVPALLIATTAFLPGTGLAVPPQLALQGTAQVAFTPGDDPGTLIVQSIAGAKRQVLVQAYSFTHQAIADALVAAKARGVDVQVVADPAQHANIVSSLVGYLAIQGIRVWLDGEHAAAHDKVMIVDAGTPDSILITGSFNFTHAAQYRNAENLLILRGNPLLTEAYAANWRRHRLHSLPMRMPITALP
jgi:phosphatidylserine/phosphatidylglycerophosphate/cardiolipin synthase-like enzyme